MSQPLSNFQMRDAEALLHPYTDPAALRETGALAPVEAALDPTEAWARAEGHLG